jgi:hypothetical protein
MMYRGRPRASSKVRHRYSPKMPSISRIVPWPTRRTVIRAAKPVPALMSLWSVHDEVNLYYRRYSGQRLRQVLTEQGFEIVAVSYCFTWPLGLMYLRKLLLGTKPRPNQDYSVRIPPRPINAMFFGLSCFEQWLMHRRVRLPIGSSLLAVARRPP